MSSSGRLPVTTREADLRASEKTRRSSAPADRMMHAWSMDALRSTTAGSTMVRTKKDECPPEAYLG